MFINVVKYTILMDFKIFIIGYGRMGKLLDKIFSKKITYKTKKYNVKTYFYDSNSKLQKKKRFRNKSFAKEADLIFFVVPIRAFEKTIKEFKKYLDEKIVFDTCTVKVHPAKVMKKHLKNSKVIATHPLFGPESVKKLKRKKIMYFPLSKNVSNEVKLLKELIPKDTDLLKATPEDHDKQLALTMNIPHWLGLSFNKIHMEKKPIYTYNYLLLLEIAERVKKDNFLLEVDIQKYNPYAKKIRQDLIKALKYFDKEYQKCINKKE